MSALPSYFSDFLANIRLQADDIADLKRGHTTLRQQLLADPDLGGKIVGTFLQGSYRRATAVKPENGKRSDVDVVVVTTIDKGEYTPEQTLAAFKPFMDRHYKGKYEVQGRSIGIELSYVDLDCVITAAPSVSEQGVLKSSVVMSEETIEDATDDWRVMFSTKATPQWKVDPLWIPDRDVQCWTATHPLEQIRWTQEKNQRCKTHYINVVKAAQVHDAQVPERLPGRAPDRAVLPRQHRLGRRRGGPDAGGDRRELSLAGRGWSCAGPSRSRGSRIRRLQADHRGGLRAVLRAGQRGGGHRASGV